MPLCFHLCTAVCKLFMCVEGTFPHTPTFGNMWSQHLRAGSCSRPKGPPWEVVDEDSSSALPCPALLCPGYVTLREQFCLSMPQFPHPLNRNSKVSISGCGRLRGTVACGVAWDGAGMQEEVRLGPRELRLQGETEDPPMVRRAGGRGAGSKVGSRSGQLGYTWSLLPELTVSGTARMPPQAEVLMDGGGSGHCICSPGALWESFWEEVSAELRCESRERAGRAGCGQPCRRKGAWESFPCSKNQSALCSSPRAGESPRPVRFLP